MNPSDLTDREKANLATHNQSLKLLTKFDTPELLPLPRIAPSLLQLKRKIAAANQKFSHVQTAKTSASLWLSDTAHIDQKSLRDQADRAKEHLSIISKPQQKQAPNWATLEFSGVGSLQKEDFLFYNENRIAHQAVKLTVSKGEKNRALHQARVAAISRLAGKIQGEDSRSQDGEDQNQVANFKLEEAVAEAVELDGKKVLQNLHTRLSVAEPINTIKLLAEQVNLLTFIKEASKAHIDQKEKERQTRNCLFIIGAKFLEKIYSKGVKQQRIADNDIWQSAYSLLRAGKTKQAAKKLQNFSNISKSLQKIDDNLSKFQSIDINLTDEPNSSDNVYQSTIKLMLKGTYDVKSQNDPLEEAWVMLMSLGLRRRGRDQKKENNELVGLRVKVQQFYEGKVKKMRNNREWRDLALGLISLGAFDLVVDLHKKVARGMKLNDEAEFIHIFLLIASNPELVSSFFPTRNGSISAQADQIINTCMEQIILFAKRIFLFKNKHFDHYFNLITSIFSKLESDLSNFDLLPAVRILCAEIFDRPSVLAQFSTKKMKILESKKLSKLFFEQLLRGMKLTLNKDYFDLAQFYQSYFQNDIAHHIISALIIREITVSNEKHKSIQEALVMLEKLEQKDKELLEDFFRNLLKLKEMIAERRREDLKKSISQWSSFRNNNELLQLLQEMKARDGVNYTNVYLFYYQQLRPAYQAVYAITDRLSQAQQIGKTLSKELQEFKRSGLLVDSPEFSGCVSSLTK